MKLSTPGYRVAVVGASSLLGKEVLAVLEERRFPVSQLITLGASEADEKLDLPILDLGGNPLDGGEDPAQAAFEQADQVAGQAEVDIAFLAGGFAQAPSFLSAPGRVDRVLVIDLGENRARATSAPAQAPDETLSVPFLDREIGPGRRNRESKRFASPHPAVIIIGTLLARLGSRSRIRSAVTQVFGPASEIGPRGIEELQKQTLNLLSFQKIPQAVFGAQLAFNILPRLGRARRGGSGAYRDDLTDLESRIRAQLAAYLAGLSERVPLPALRVIQVPVFYALTVSLYVETEQPADPQSVAQALGGGHVRVRRFSDPAPSQVDVTGTSDILVDAIAADGGHPAGMWLWATADNLRLAAVNAVEIAESVKELSPPPRR